MKTGISHNISSEGSLVCKTESVVSGQNYTEDVPETTFNQSYHFDTKSSTTDFDVTNYMEEDQRRNVEAWQRFDELTAVINKIDRLNEIVLKIQELLAQLVVVKK